MNKETTTTPADENHDHYAWGASAASTWRGCHGSINLASQELAAGNIPAKDSTKYSDEGTEAHDWADKALNGKIERKDIPKTFRENLEGYLDFAEEIAESLGDCEVLYEQQVPLFYNPEKTGTLDYAIASNGHVEILDLKYGVGVYVQAAENDQLAIYALSLINGLSEKYNFDDNTTVRMHIWQPRHRDFDGCAQTWETTLRDLMDQAIDIQADYETSKAAGVEDLTPSKHACQFCKARKVCTARVVDLFEDIPEELNPTVGEVDIEKAKASGAITDVVRARIAAKGKELAKFFTDLNEDTLLLMEQGKHIKDLKVVQGGKGNRQWGDNEEEADKLLRKLPATARYQPKKLVSPAQAEKALKKADMSFDQQSTRFQNRFKELIQQKEGKNVLVTESDPRPAIAGLSETFDEVVEETPEVECF